MTHQKQGNQPDVKKQESTSIKKGQFDSEQMSIIRDITSYYNQRD